MSNMGSAVLIALLVSVICAAAVAVPASDGVGGSVLSGAQNGARGAASRARRFPAFPLLSRGRAAARVRLAQLDPADVALEDDDGLFELNKRQMSDDYGHMRFGKRGEGEFDDYGHMRFGRSGDSAAE